MGFNSTRWCVLCPLWASTIEGSQVSSEEAKGVFGPELQQVHKAISASPEKWKEQLGAVRKVFVV